MPAEGMVHVSVGYTFHDISGLFSTASSFTRDIQRANLLTSMPASLTLYP